MSHSLTHDEILSVSKDRLPSTHISNLKSLILMFLCISKNITIDSFLFLCFNLIIFNSIEKPPKKSDLLEQISMICSRWYTIGDCLGIESGDLDSLNSSNESDEVKLSKVLQLWMERMTKPVTWNTILEVIGSPPIQNKLLVKKLENFLECKYLYNNPSNTR